ncbi:unnamed protein product [Chondrus crispus]|uniref:phospholipase A2 n=1 Tax=Chondrus crispus TaxID=2769 RepID=R7Q7T2_CHOCR|nr:unnamed protein product [Chondrus crispus]CDF34602.1 unnamed protein product [Chondrus crispus]|eukprot:XP_005714421.1 unnamed protein product [Chondrus crispus]
MSQIAAWRGPDFGLLGYWHHGVMCPDGTVIHYTTGSHLRDKVQPRSKRRAKIIRTNLDNFRKDAPAIYDVVPGPTAPRLPVEEAVARAESRLGEATYNLLFNNCETFANWCVSGEGKSRQIGHHMRYVARGFVPFGLPGAVVGIFASAFKMSVGDVRRQRMKIRGLLGGKDDDEKADEAAEETEADVPGESAEMLDEQNENFIEGTASKSAKTLPATPSASAKTLADTPAKKSGKTPAITRKKTFIARAKSAKLPTSIARGESWDMLQDLKDAAVNVIGGKAPRRASVAVPRAQSTSNLTKGGGKMANKPREKPVDIPTEDEIVPNPVAASVTSSKSLA